MVRSKEKTTDTMSSSPGREGSANAGSANGNAEEKPRLSEHEKKANHIASGILPCYSPFDPSVKWSSLTDGTTAEQKRRQAIREGFDRLTELVPGLEGQGRSESVVLKKTVDYMREQLTERRRLVAQIEELGGEVDDGIQR